LCVFAFVYLAWGQVSLSAFCFLFSEMVQYQQNKVNTTQELEKKLAENGYGVGVRMSELCFFREKNAKREIKVVGILSYIKDNIWKTMFGKPADSLERATDKQDECNVAPAVAFSFARCSASPAQHSRLLSQLRRRARVA